MRDLRRIDECMGDGVKRVQDCEIQAKQKMGKALYVNRDLSAGHILSRDDIEVKSPGDGLPPYRIESIMGKKLRVSLPQESSISLDDLESV